MLKANPILLQLPQQGLRRLLVSLRSCLPKGRLVRSAALLSGSTLLAQVAGICLAPVYTRLYAPADYGVSGQVYSTIALLLTVGCFCYELAIPTVKEEEEALALVVLCFGVIGIITVGSLGWALIALWNASDAHLRAQQLYFLLVPIGVLLSGLYRIVLYWAIRNQNLKAIAGTTVSQMMGGQAVNLSFGLLHPSPLGLILSQIVSTSAGAGHLSLSSRLLELLKTHRASVFRVGRLWETARKHRQYALTQCPSTLLNSVGLYLPGMLMLPYFGPVFAGMFNLAQRIGRIPIGLVGSSFSQVFFSEGATLARKEPHKLRPLFQSVSRKLALCGLAVMIACLLAPVCVPIVFGRRWQEAGVLTMWLGFGLAFQLCVSPLSNMPNIVGRLKGQLVIDAVRAALVLAALYIPWRLGMGGRTAVVCYSAVMVANYIACYLLYRHQVAVHSRQNLEPASLEQGVAV